MNKYKIYYKFTPSGPLDFFKEDSLKDFGKIGYEYFIFTDIDSFIEYDIVPLSGYENCIGEKYDSNKAIILKELNIFSNIKPGINLTFTANSNTSINVFFTKESYTNNKPDDIIQLKANTEKETIYNRTTIYYFTAQSPTSIIKCKIEGIIICGRKLFNGFSNLISLDVKNLDTSLMNDMYWMFYGCSKLKTIDVSNFNTYNVINMQSTFDSCYSLTSIDVTKWQTPNLLSTHAMFSLDHVLSSIDVSNFDMSNIVSCEYMFQGCGNLKTVGPIDKALKWQIKPKYYINMFSGCPATPKPSWYK